MAGTNVLIAYGIHIFNWQSASESILKDQRGLPTIGNPFRFLCSILIDHSECELNEIQARIAVNGSQIVHQYPKLF
jgi:hypothetical protein